MNPQWDDGRRELKPQHLKSILKKVPKPADDWRRYSQSPEPAVDEPSTMQQGFDPVMDEACLEVKRVDVELARKRRELEEIEERIMHKKVAVAFKQAKPLVESLSSGFHAGFDQSSSSSLRDRVHRIMQQRHPAGILSQARSPKDGRTCAGSSINGLPQKQHPLKIRVDELMKRRGCLPCPPERTVTDVNPSPVAQPPADGSCVNVGFQRFLAVLNKGVDMDLLAKIVNDDCGVVETVETVRNPEPPVTVAEPCIPPSNGSKQSNSRDESRTGSGSHSIGSSSRSRSPPAMKKTQEEEEKAKATEQHKQLQNILKTLGLNLEVGEMSRLANRTQERLYGTKRNNTNSDQHKKPPRQPRTDRNSSSRSSSSSSFSGSKSSRSSSRSVSPPCNRLTRSKDSLLRTASKPHKSTQELLKHRAQTAHTIKTSRQPQQNPPYLLSGPSSAYHNGSFPQYGPQYDIPPSGVCNQANQAISPYWPPHTHPQLPPHYPTEQPYQQNPYPPFHEQAAQPGSYYSHQIAMTEDINLQVTPNWTGSEWQSETTARPRCLQEISTESERQSSLTVHPQFLQEFSIQQSICWKQLGVCSQSMQGNNASQANQSSEARRRRRKRWRMNRNKRRLQEQIAEAAVLKAKALAQQEVNNSGLVTLDDEEEKEKKQPPREAKIKAKLRIKLKAFNEEAKQKIPQPQANSEPADSCQSHPDLTN